MVALSKADVKNTVTTISVDERGQPLEEDRARPQYCADHLTIFVPASTAQSPLYLDFYSKLLNAPYPLPRMFPAMHTSDISSRFTVFRTRSCTDVPRRTSYNIVYDPLPGVSASTTLSNLTPAWIRTSMRYTFEPSHAFRHVWFEQRARVANDYVQRAGSLNGSGAGVRIDDISNDNPSGPFTLFAWQGSSMLLTLQSDLGGEAIPPGEPAQRISTGPFCTVRDGRRALAPSFGAVDGTFLPAEDELEVNDGPVHPTRLVIPGWVRNDMVTLEGRWFGPLNDYRQRESGLAQMKLFDPDGNEIAPSSTEPFRQHYRKDGLKLGVHRAMSVDSNYITAGLRGRATLTVTFDTRRDDLADSDITALRVMNGKGEGRSLIAANDTLQVAFVLADYDETPLRDPRYDPVRTDSAKLSIRPHGSTVWSSVPLRVVGGSTSTTTATFKEALPAGIEFRGETKPPSPGYYDLKIEGDDGNGNRTELVLEPAFAVSNGARHRAVR